jgi:hypothetical protein
VAPVVLVTSPSSSSSPINSVVLGGTDFGFGFSLSTPPPSALAPPPPFPFGLILEILKEIAEGVGSPIEIARAK